MIYIYKYKKDIKEDNIPKLKVSLFRSSSELIFNTTDFKTEDTHTHTLIYIYIYIYIYMYVLKPDVLNTSLFEDGKRET